VSDVAVIGLPDAERGERCCAVVASPPGVAPLDFEEMLRFLKDEGLMLQKIPEQLETLPELPRNPTGKVLKQDLRRRYADDA
jgi:non-ribosomal peptide synthetase component E (peptide arylation enzyme)